MTDEQYDRITTAEDWLMRTWNDDNELTQLITKREKILCSLSGIGKYDEKAIPGSDTNPTETKNIEYTVLSQMIEKIQERLSFENVRTLEVISKIDDSKIRGMLIGRYINRQSWRKVGESYHYAERHSYNYRTKCLEAVYPFIPKGDVIYYANDKAVNV